MVGTGGRFFCDACGKALVWKQALAGKRAKCSCGAITLVPPQPAAVGARPKAATPTAPTAPVVQATLGYVSANVNKPTPTAELDTDKLIDKVRDIYVPTGLVAFGFILFALWGLVGSGLNPQVSVLALVASCVSTMIKTIVLVLVCVAITSKHGEVSFGTLWVAVLKLSAIVLISDAMLVWFEAWQIYRGAIEIRHGVMYIDIWLLVWEVFMAAFLIAVLLWYLLDIEKEQMFQIAGPVAIASMAIGLGLRFAVAWGVNAYVASTTPPPPPPGTPPPTTVPVVVAAQPTTKPATKPVIIETARDKAIRQSIENGDFKEWYEHPVTNGYQRSLFKKLLDAHPRNMYVESRTFLAPKLYVELPTKDEYYRSACFVAYTEYCQDAGIDIDPNEAKDTRQRFLVIRLQK
jgi:hypothetical protein